MATTENSLNLAELADQASAFARSLTAAGVREGSIALFSLPNTLVFVPAFLALCKLSCSIILASPRYGTAELSFIINHAAPDVMLFDRGVAGMVEGVISGLPYKKVPQIILDDELLILIPPTTARRRTPTEAKTSLMKFSSGSTGTPKGICLSIDNLLAETETILSTLQLTERDTILAPVPLSHSYGFDLGLLAMIGSGCSLSISEQFIPRQIMRQLSQASTTVFLGVPSMYRFLVNTRFDEQYALRHVRKMISCTAPLPGSVATGFKDKFGAKILQHYGSSETGAVSLHDPEHVERRPDSVGRPMNNVTVTIIGSDGKLQPPGVEGEIVVESRAVAMGYLGGDPPGRNVLGDGKFRTGDIGLLDEDGYLFVHSRIDDVINVGGNKVFPSEVVRVLESHPAVEEAAVTGIIDALGEESVYAVIVLRAQETDMELIRYCSSKLADYKVPRRIDLLKTIPRGPSGKVKIVPPGESH